MPPAAKRCARLIAALEDLAAQEAAAVRTGEFARAGELAERCAPLVDDLVGRAGEIVETALQERIRDVNALRARSAEALGREIVRVHEELAQTELARGRAARIAPVYGRRTARATAVSQVSLLG